jgi:hypothetical protein
MILLNMMVSRHVFLRSRSKQDLVLITFFLISLLPTLPHESFLPVPPVSGSSRLLRQLPLQTFMCVNPFPSVAFSTFRDLIFTMATDTDRWYDVTLLSIRTCGCRARVILTTELEHLFDPHFARVIQLTSTEIWRYEIPDYTQTADMVRHPWMLAFLKEHGSEFDHIFMMDAFDCYFHRDPFEELNFEGMAFCEEGWEMRSAGVNPEWIEECFNASVLKSIETFGVVCSGTIYGTPAAFIQFEQILLERQFWAHCALDQPILNYLIHTGEFRSRGVRYRLMPCNSTVLTLSNCPRAIKPVGGIPEAFNGDGVVPHVVHQWKAFENFRELYVKRCDMTDFMRKLESQLGRDLNWSAPVRGTY